MIREEIRALDPGMPVSLETLHQSVARFVQRPRFNTILLSLFAAMGVLLAAIGLYGVVSFLVAQRANEIGIRIALGATRRRIQSMILAQVAWWTGAGAVLGFAVAWFAARYLESLLFGVEPRDPMTMGAVLLLLSAVAVAAGWIPARRAARLDPIVTLRQE
ncbi:MAG: FtsX-like permease family protein [Bryobacteraceae bacterium]